MLKEKNFYTGIFFLFQNGMWITFRSTVHFCAEVRHSIEFPFQYYTYPITEGPDGYLIFSNQSKIPPLLSFFKILAIYLICCIFKLRCLKIVYFFFNYAYSLCFYFSVFSFLLYFFSFCYSLQFSDFFYYYF